MPPFLYKTMPPPRTGEGIVTGLLPKEYCVESAQYTGSISRNLLWKAVSLARIGGAVRGPVTVGMSVESRGLGC